MVDLGSPLEGSSQHEENTLLEIESRLNDIICIVKRFDHGTINDYR